MSTIENAKIGMGWLHPGARTGCGSCEHVKVQPPINVNCRPSYYCGKGAFHTTRFAICDKYEPMMLTGGAPK